MISTLSADAAGVLLVMRFKLHGTLDNLFVKGGATLSWMATTTVLSILSLTTVPTRVFLRLRSLICFVLPSAYCALFSSLARIWVLTRAMSFFDVANARVVELIDRVLKRRLKARL